MAAGNRSLLAFWAGGAGVSNPAVAGYRGMLAFWAGGGATGVAPAPSPTTTTSGDRLRWAALWWHYLYNRDNNEPEKQADQEVAIEQAPVRKARRKENTLATLARKSPADAAREAAQLAELARLGRPLPITRTKTASEVLNERAALYEQIMQHRNRQKAEYEAMRAEQERRYLVAIRAQQDEDDAIALLLLNN